MHVILTLVTSFMLFFGSFASADSANNIANPASPSANAQISSPANPSNSANSPNPMNLAPAKPLTAVNPAQNVNAINNQSLKPKITIYDAPTQNAKIIAKVDPYERLVPIYRKGVWIKVGNPYNGDIGWINTAEHQKMLSQVEKDPMQMVFVHVNENNSGEQNYQVTAYKNGAKLSETEAQALYQKLMQEQKLWRQRYMAMQREMESLFEREMDALNSAFMSMPQYPMIQPVMVIEHSPRSN